MYLSLSLHIYIYTHTSIGAEVESALVAHGKVGGRGRDKRGRRRGAAIPPTEPSQGNVDNVWRDVATYNEICCNILQNLAPRAHLNHIYIYIYVCIERET